MNTRRNFLSSSLGIAGSLAAGSFPRLISAQEKPKVKGKYNVLFIAVDDLRPQMACYGQEKMHTPHMDALAKSGTLFQKAYCQQAVCSPSRTSLMTGRRPDTTRIYDLQTHFRLYLPDVVTLSQYFKQHGYHSQGFSKIYHGGLGDPQSWSVKHWRPGGPGYLKPETIALMKKQRAEFKAKGLTSATKTLKKDPKTGIKLKVSRPKFRVRGPAWEDPDAADNALPDGKTADKVIQTLRQLKDRALPVGNGFFLAAGFLKPHLPFVAPKKYFDLYPKGSLTLADNPFPPKGGPSLALHNSGELRSYSDIPKKGQIDDQKALELIHGYHACVSYIDAQIGRIIDELDRLGMRENTVIVLWGDHGWQLGEHGLWCKHTNFETSARAPMICSVPGQKSRGIQSQALTEFVDIYPTLCELCDLPLPEGLEGTSFVPLLDEPDRPWKEAAFSQYPRGKYMGYSMRTQRHRYTEWGLLGEKPIAVELYDHDKDPDENLNLAGRPENKELVSALSDKLRRGWRGALPPRV